MSFVYRNRKIILLFFICVCLVVVMKIFSQPGTQQDPVISRSYAEKFFQWNRVALDAGQKIEIYPFTSFILHLGEYTGEGRDIKILDLTDGKEITNIEKIKKNHVLLLVSDNPLVLKAKKNAVLFTQGKYKIE